MRPIMYGLPSREMMKRDDVSLGGCVIGGADPLQRCNRCHVDFDFTNPEMAGAEAAERGWVEAGGGGYESEETAG